MSSVVDQLLRSPRAQVYLEEMTTRLSHEREARQQFRETMNEDTRAEFINGTLVAKDRSTFKHNRVSEHAYCMIGAHLSKHHLGLVGHGSYLIALTFNDVEPDVVFWSQEKSEKFTDEQLLFPAPDLVVEVLSKSTAVLDRGVKFEDYAAHGVTEYWIIDADECVVEQYVLRGDAYDLRLKSSDGTLNCFAVTGLSFNVRALFDDVENRRAVDELR